MEKQYYVYIMTNVKHSVLYTGITNDLKKRIYQHKAKLVDGFTKRYNIIKLVYFEVHYSAEEAILREKCIKGGSRKKKIDLVNSMNEGWVDLYSSI